MKNIDSVELSKFILSIQNDNSVLCSEMTAGAPTQLEGLSIGLVTMETSTPHNGERHNDGDEIIIVVSGKIAVESDSNPDQLLTITAGNACVIRKGEWHKIKVVEKAQLVYLTPGMNNEYRF